MTFVRSDTSTQGNWVSLSGGQGYSVVGGTTNLPSFASVVNSGQSTWTWSASTTDPRAPLTSSAADAGRVAAAWYSGDSLSFTVDVNLTDGVTHLVALYALDWDNAGRTERVDAVDPANGSVLDSRTVSSFTGGQYLVYNVTGHVQFRITDVAGANAVLSGLFFGGAFPTSDRHSDSDSHSEADGYPDTNSHSDGHSEADGYSDPNSHSNSHSEADCYSNANWQ